jgi:curved DNA-binding protein CbpA
MNSQNNSNNNKKSDFMIDFYEVLGIEETANLAEIKKKYAELVKKYHPDKNPDDYDEALFQLIQRAYECLSNPEKRTEYDFFMKNVKYAKNNDHNKLKQTFDSYKDLQGKKEITEEDLARAKLEFQIECENLDKKHNFDRKKMDDNKLTNDEISNRFNELMLQREQDELEFTQNNLFEGQSFSTGKFNAMFDLYKNGHSGNSGNTEVTKYGNVNAFNDNGGFTSINDMNNLYDDNNYDSGSNMYSNVNFGKENRLDKDKLKNIHEANYTKNHNKKDENYMIELERRMREREDENNFYNNRKLDDFDTKDKSFQSLQEVGVTDNILEFEQNHEELLEACNKLIALKVKEDAK